MPFVRPIPGLQVHCGEPSYKDPPQPADCQYVLAHLPSIHAPDIQDVVWFDTGISSAIPFFPNINVLHGSCRINVDVDRIRASFKHSKLALEKYAAFEAWTMIRQSIESIIQVCVGGQRTTGTGIGFVDNEAVVFQIEVGDAASDYQLDAQRQAMGYSRAGSEFDQDGYWGQGLFRKTFYQV